MRWNGHVARMGRGAYRVLARKRWGKKENLEDPGVDGRLI